jgi:D-xylose transport system substrate-binding protein
MLMTAFMIRLLEFRSEGAAAGPADRRRMIGGLIRPVKKRVVSLQHVTKKVAMVAVAASAALVGAACSSGTSGGGGGGGGGGSSAPVPQISASDFNNTFSAMTKLKPLAKAGKGNVAVILPDTVSSARYTEFDAPYLTKALTLAGLSSSQFTVQNAQGSDATELSDAQTAITKGASVLIMDPLDSTVGASIES